MRKIISLICLLLPIVAYADTLTIREDAPDRHIVVKGDTLWDISAKFFKDPWKWQQIWGMNKDSISDPHWIYPGDIIFLDRKTGTLHVVEPGRQEQTVPSDNDVIKLSPRVRELKSDHDSIPFIPVNEIAPFLSKPLAVENIDFNSAPSLLGTFEHRQLLGQDDIGYVKNLPADKGIHWQIYRLGKEFIDPETEELLGHEVYYLGDAVVEKFAPISEVRVTKSISEIAIGNYFTQSPEEIFNKNYEPHAPNSRISAKIISILGEGAQAGQSSVIVLNKGKRDGIENGHVLALYQKGEVLKEGNIFKPNDIKLPDVRYGLVFVFKTMQKISYALVLQTKLPAQLLDTAQTP